MSEKRSQRRTATGVVDRGPQDKTIVVKSTRLVEHPKYHRYVRARDAVQASMTRPNRRSPGDTVEIMETRPISKTKHWRLVRVVSRARRGREARSQS